MKKRYPGFGKACYVGTQKTLIGRMPVRKGYPYKPLYWEIKNLITRLKVDFKRDGYVYFGYKKEIELFGYKEYAYIYVDKYKVLKGYNDYRDKHEEEFTAMKDKDKDWMEVSFGYFIIAAIILLELRKAKGDSKVSTSEIFGKGQALKCFLDKKNVVHVETPSKQ